jgi:hypothetical protein
MTIIRDGFQSADLDVPVVLPTLNLDFANSQKLDSRITFSRGSIGTFVNKNGLIETASANIPRFDYDSVTGECKGLLIEESRQNLVTYSEDYSNAIWTKLGVSVTTNAAIAPDGTLTADLITENNSSAFHQVYYSTATLTANTYTISAFVKQGVGNRYFRFGGFGLTTANEAPIFNISTGEVYLPSTTTLFKSASITPYPNGWYRCTCTIEYTGSTGVPYFTTSNSSTNFSNISYTTDTTSSIYMWGAQVEVGVFPTSYIPTTSSTVTRSADNASMTGTNFSSWYNQTEGSIYCRYDRLGIGIPSISASTNVWTVVFDPESTTYMTLINGFASPSTRRFDVRTSGTFTSQQSLSSTEISNTFYRSAVSYKQDNIGLFFNGRNIASDRECSIPTVNKLNIGKQVADNTTLSGHISRLTYYPRSLSASQLQYLTQ